MAQFTINFEMNDKGLTTFFKYKQFTIPEEIRKNWNNRAIDENGLNYPFKLAVDKAVLSKYSQNPELYDILQDMVNQEAYFVIKNSNGVRYGGSNQYIYCKMPEVILSNLKKLFVSTLVYQAQGKAIPEMEKISFTFSTNPDVVLISDLILYTPIDNPFYEYAKNAVASLSVEAIGLKQYSIENNNQVRDFYNLTQTVKWKDAKQLDKETGIDDKPGVYMLYDEENNTFYVGKAIKLKSRILQHRQNANGNDPIPNFTHYRYSVISGEYYEFLYLIENAAIHDCAWLLDMPNAKKFTPSLAKKVTKLNECKMVNTQEHQTRKQ